jgi:hypothetical protein
MGVFARILVFPNAEVKLRKFDILDKLAEEKSPMEYDSIRLYNEDYGLDKTIRLLFKVSVQSILYRDYISNIYKIDLDVPVEHNSLEGSFNVKEKRDVQLVHFLHPSVENMAIMTTAHGSSTIMYALRALNKQGFMPIESYIELPLGKKVVDVLKELGNIGWVYVSDIPDAHLKGAGLLGSMLQKSEVLEDLITRGGRVKAAIIEHSERNIRIIISRKGSIYSQKNIDIFSMANIVREVISVLKKYNLIRYKV